MRLAVRRFPTVAAALALILGLTPGAAPAQVPPHARWATIESANFRVTFGPGLEELARHAARRAEVAHARLAAELAAAPAGKIDILLTDYMDVSNGTATPIPSNRITLYARPPVDLTTLSYFDDWIDLVVTHELAHIFHLDATGRLGRGFRAAFGRVPASWPFFPALGTPTWSIEGLATYIESRFTGAGRVEGSYHEMVLRTAILEDAFASLDQVSGTGATWPGGARSYIYGSLFLEHLSRSYGPEVQQRLVEAAAGAWLPPAIAFNRVARKATGSSFSQLFAEWRSDLETRYQALADSLRAAGLTTPEPVGKGGYHTLHPRVGPNGRVAYASADGRRAAANRILDPATGAVRTLSRRNDIGPLAWSPDGALLTAQLEFDGPYRLYSDLYRVDVRGREHRLTRGARLSEPDLAPDGRRILAVQAAGGTNRLVVYDLETGAITPLTAADPKVHWAFPRWAPDGSRLAVGRWEAGAYDVVILDSLGALQYRLTADRALDTAPAWSPDGRYLVFSSDRSGIPNLYAYDLSTLVPTGNTAAAEVAGAAAASADAASAASDPALRQLTNLLTGAFFPDISPDGRWVYFSAYHADGFHIERIPFDTATWREAAPVKMALWRDAAEATAEIEAKGAKAARRESELVEGSPGDARHAALVPGPVGGRGQAALAAAGAEPGPARPYSPLRSLRPRYWIPTLESRANTGAFYGALTSGEDLVGRHAYALAAAYQPSDRLFQGELSYRYTGLGLPHLGFAAARSWEGSPITLSGATGARLLHRDDEFRLSATLLRQRRRSAAQLTLAAEGILRKRILRDADEYRLLDPSDRLLGAMAQVGFASYRVQPFSISPEDGISLSLAGRRRWDLEPDRSPAGGISRGGYDEVSGQFSSYKALGLPGFANHVLAARVGARWRQGPGAAAFGIGGTSGTPLDLGIETIGRGNRLLPVRGFSENERTGTRAWSASLEYRFPLTLIDRGAGLAPLYLDNLSGALFLDAGNAGCGAADRTPLNICSAEGAPALVASGAELALDATFFFAIPTRLRGGIAFPLQGRSGRPELYLQFGLPF
jgi:Tol biopolymer transport system component